MKNEILNVCDQLVIAAANGVYQGIIIAVLVALCLRWLVRTNAATRHAIWFCTLLLLVALVVAQGVFDPFLPGPAALGDVAFSSDAELAAPAANAANLFEAELKTEDALLDSTNVHDDDSSEEHHPLLAALIQAQQESAEEVTESASETVEATNENSAGAGAASHASDESTGLPGLIERLLNPIPVELTVGSRFSRIAGILVAGWLMIAGLRAFTLIVQLTRIRRLKHQLRLPGAELSELFQTLATRLVRNRKVELRVSPAHRSSFLLGFLHPVILLPANGHMKPEEAEFVLRHELAHVERRDDWFNLIQHFVLAVFFFHPAFWWISRQLSLEREIACDDHVLQQSKQPKTYALVLAELATQMQKGLSLLAPGSSNNKTQLKERIDMILNTHRNASPRLAKTWLALITSTSAIVAVAVICSAPRLVLAQVETTTTDIVATAAADVLPVVHVTDVVPAASIAGLPHPDSAGSVPPHAPLTATISVVPGFKAGSPVTVTTSPAVIAGPDVSLAPVKTRLSVTASVPGQPAVLAAIKPPATPLPQPVPRPAQAPRSESPGASLEERLDRLERMLNSLMNQQNQKGHSDFQLKLEREGMLDRKEIARIEGLAKQHAELARKMNPQESERIKERATREAQQAVEQAKRATAEMEKARKADQKQALRKLKAEPQRQLEDLRRQVETLERQREKLDREIERLEQDQQELDEHDDDSADIDTHFNESKEICVTETHSQSQSHSAR